MMGSFQGPGCPMQFHGQTAPGGWSARPSTRQWQHLPHDWTHVARRYGECPIIKPQVTGSAGMRLSFNLQSLLSLSPALEKL